MHRAVWIPMLIVSWFAPALLAQDDVAVLQEKLTAAEAMISELQAKLDVADAVIKDQREQYNNAVAALKASQTRLQEEVAANQGKAQEVIDALRAQNDALATQLDDDRAKTAQVIAVHEERHKALVDLVTRQQKQLEEAGISRQQVITGKVLAVKDGDLLQISIGSDQGLTKESTIHVYRDLDGKRTIVGEAHVIYLAADKAACKLTKEPNVAPQPGDTAGAMLGP